MTTLVIFLKIQSLLSIGNVKSYIQFRKSHFIALRILKKFETLSHLFLNYVMTLCLNLKSLRPGNFTNENFNLSEIFGTIYICQGLF